jgi:hypothetical protein
MDYGFIWIFLIIAVYLVGAYFAIRLVNKLTYKLSLPLRKLSESLCYALFFGIGILSRGGDPGFGIPMPILAASFFGVWDWIPTMIFIDGIIIPFFFWWGLFFIIVWVRSKSFQRKKHNQG